MSLVMCIKSDNLLTAGSFPVVAEVALLWFHGDVRLIPHGVDLRHAEPGVLPEEEASGPNSQVVLTPVPQVLEIVIVDGGERIHAGNGRRQRRWLRNIRQHQSFYWT